MYLGCDLKEGTFQELDQKLRPVFQKIEHVSDEYTADKYGTKSWIDQLKKTYTFKELRAYNNYEYGLYYEATRHDKKAGGITYHPCTNIVVFEETCRTTLLPNKQGKLIPLNSSENAKKIGVPWDNKVLELIDKRPAKNLTVHKSNEIAVRTLSNWVFSTSHIYFNGNGSIDRIEF